MKSHSVNSSVREQVVECMFLGSLTQTLWTKGVVDFEILHAGSDHRGYDVLVEANGILRHIQLKSSLDGAKTSRQNVNLALGTKPSGCVIWVILDPESMDQIRYLWFGNEPGVPLDIPGGRIAKHTKGDSKGTKTERPGIRIVNKGEFTQVESIFEIAELLFGNFAGEDRR